MNVIHLPKLDEVEFSLLNELLDKITIRLIQDKGRRGFAKHRGCVFGMTKPRYIPEIRLSAYSKKYPKIHDEIMRIGNLICPDGFSFNSVQLNENVTCPPHKDSKNVGFSILVSFGNYTGGNIVVDNVVYDARHHPIMFNGAELEHYNTPDLEGHKYSLVFFTCNDGRKKPATTNNI